MNKTCPCCGETKSETHFNLANTGSKKRVNVCKSCTRVFAEKITANVPNQKINCKYPAKSCHYSYLHRLCCHECPMEKWCDKVCFNKPELCEK